MDELIEQASTVQLQAALRDALQVIDQLSAASGMYMREDIADKIREAHISLIKMRLSEVAVVNT